MHHTGQRALCLAANLEYNEPQIVTTCEVESEIRRFEYLILNIRNCNCAGSGWVQILHSVNRMMYLASDVEYSAHRMANVSAKQAEKPWFEYVSINIQNCNHVGFPRVQSWQYANGLMCAVFGSKCAVLRTSYCRRTYNGYGDSFTWISSLAYAKSMHSLSSATYIYVAGSFYALAYRWPGWERSGKRNFLPARLEW